ncbi:MAG: MlaD family protein [Parvibaculum sp.]|uniref:MlaD family protein n=1 Tax=Parvibaculum sp. TaxID=2024848 RepID=UPI0025DE0AE6|nr:MlaD family protein [Parvibaculum sp.]MCE9650745.1 MlaD family protein [Parvibaculum sp.]
MEIKSNNVLIGFSTLIVLVMIFAFTLWISRVQLDRQYAYYKIIFSGSVSGLSKSGPVQFNGLPVGRVIDLALAEKDPTKVIAIIQVDARTPVKKDSIAQLEASGITGLAVVQLTGGSPGSPLLSMSSSETYPVIRGAPSTLQELAKAAPETLQNANRLIEDLGKVVRANQESIASTLKNIDALSSALAGSSNDMRQAIKDISEASRNLKELSHSADGLVQNDAKAFIDDARQTSASYRQLADSLDHVVKTNGPAIDRLANNGLDQLPQLIREMRGLVNSLDRVVSRAQDDPARFLIGNNVPEVKAK